MACFAPTAAVLSARPLQGLSALQPLPLRAGLSRPVGGAFSGLSLLQESLGVSLSGAAAKPASAPAVLARVAQPNASQVATRAMSTSLSSSDDLAFISPAEARRPGFEALLRALLAGVGAGILSELLHVGAAFTANPGADAAALHAALSPLYALDHVAAVSTSLVFYALEAAAMLAILRGGEHGAEPARVARALRSASTLPKRMLPLRLKSMKAALHAALKGRGPAWGLSAPATTGASASSEAAPFAGLGLVTVLQASSAPSLSRSTSSMLDQEVSRLPTPQGPKKEDEEQKTTKRPRKVAKPNTARARVSVKPLPRPTTAPAAAPSPITTKREKELSDRGTYLKNFWYAAALSQNLKADKPLKVAMLGRTITLFRDEDGTPCCLDNICPHRGAPLSDGWVKKVEGHGNCVVCPYHGWAFDKEGKLGEVPSNSAGASYPKRSLVDAYSVEERGGFVWLFFGDKNLRAEERPPIPLCEELEDPNWKSVYGELEFDSDHHSTFENAIDMAHIHYLHEGSFGNQDKPEIKDMAVETHDWHISAKFQIHNKPPNALWNWTATPAVPVEARAYLPSTSYVKITLGGGVQMITFVNTVPIDEKRTVNRFCLIRNFAHQGVFDPFAKRAMFQILGEDKVMLDKLRPDQIKQEVSLEADLPQIAFRRLRQQWVDMGYGVAPTSTPGHEGSLVQ